VNTRSLRLLIFGFLTIMGLSFVTMLALTGRAQATRPAALVRDGQVVHVVSRGETLAQIAKIYDIDPARLAAHNGIRDPDAIFAGQRLYIPIPLDFGPTPAPSKAVALPCLCEEIIIVHPTRGLTITNPITVTGIAMNGGQGLVVAVLDGSAQEIGRAYAVEFGTGERRGAFTATVSFGVPPNSQPGRIQVWQVSPRDGAIAHLSSVEVGLQGLELDPLLLKLEDVITAGDEAALESLTGNEFQVVRYRPRGPAVPAVRGIETLALDDLDLGAARLDFSVDARKLLDDRVQLGPDIVHVVFSTGWGPEQSDDAFLFIGEVKGAARWVGMLYMPKEEIDYR
jgi:LysM repeat protein